MRKTRRVAFLVAFDVPAGATVTACQNYVRDAVATMAGTCRPPGSYDDQDDGDPLFSLDRDSIRVTRPRKYA